MAHRVTAFFAIVACIFSATAEPRIHRIEPLALVIGETTEVVVQGEQLRDKDAPTDVWSTFPSDWELLEETVDAGKEPDPRRLRFRVSVPADANPGPAAIRIWNSKGVSPPYLVLKDPYPASHSFQLKRDAPESYTFGARAGQHFICELWSNRLNQDTDLLMTLHDAEGRELAMADDDEVSGADPILRFTAAENGSYTIQVQDIRWRAGDMACLRVARTPLIAPANPKDVRKTPKGMTTISIPAESGQHLTITPRTVALGSPALLLMDLHDPKGHRCAQSGTGDKLDEVLRKKIDQAGDYQLKVRELLTREGLPYTVDITTDQAPFKATVDGNREWREVPVGSEQKIKFRVSRYQFDGPITLTSSAFTMTNNVIPEKKGEIEAQFTLPEDLEPNQLIPFEVYASAELNGQTYTTRVNTLSQLKRTPKRLLHWPDGLDRVQYFLTKPKKKKEEKK